MVGPGWAWRVQDSDLAGVRPPSRGGLCSLVRVLLDATGYLVYGTAVAVIRLYLGEGRRAPRLASSARGAGGARALAPTAGPAGSSSAAAAAGHTKSTRGRWRDTQITDNHGVVGKGVPTCVQHCVCASALAL